MTEIVHKFPGSLDNLGFRRGTADWGITFAIPKEYFSYAKPLGDKLGMFFVVAAVPVGDREQAECLLAEQVEIPSLTAGESGPEFVATTTQMQEMFGLTGQHIAVLERSGIIFKISRGKYDVVKSVQGYIADLRRQTLGKNEGYSEERTKKLRIQRESAELDLLKQKGELVNAELIQKAVEQDYLTIKNKLAYIPSKAAPLCEQKTAPEVQEILDDHIRECLAELSGVDVARIVVETGKKGAGSRKETKDERLGGRKKSPVKKNKRRTRKVADK